MRQPKLIKLTLLIVTLFAMASSGASAERLHESLADFLRLDSNQIYLWVEDPITANQDFSIEIERQETMLYRTRVSGVLGKVVVSSVLPADIVEMLHTKKDCVFSVFLESDMICDSLIIAMPSNLRALWLDTLFTANTSPPIRYLFRYYDDIKEVEIATKLRQVDLLIAPEFELPQAPIFVDSPYLLEWNLNSSPIKNDLLATALNDCVRGILADSNDSAYSSLIIGEHLRSIFPRNAVHAHELFSQSKRDKDKFDCYFPGYKMYPALADRINLELDSCSGRKFAFRDAESQPLALTFMPLDDHADSLCSCAHAISKLADPIREVLSIKSSSTLDSCLLGLLPLNGCCESVSHALAESARFVPLGRSRLAIKHFDHVRWLDRNSGAAKLSDYYSVKR